eukprot:GFUD01017777.1.p1 GENE.GFUD01017777.1~~GFUD01017777.1.p1  ORF type:complete len:374 (-),score=154.83 GFUD01017777.1:188-1309(-)
MSDKRRLVYSIIQFCQKELQAEDLSDDAKESLEVASQCLQSAYALNTEDKHLEVSKSLPAIFQEVTKNEPLHKKSPPSAGDKEEADRLKTEGNNLMRTEKFVDALEMYSKAIELDGSNPVFYCNRAAAHSKMNNHHLAIEDCQRAIDMDPSYSKAYGRMGLAHSSLEKHKEAVENFKKALELEPDNDSYKSNLQIAEDKVKSGVSPGMGGMPGMGGFPGMGGPGGLDLGSFLNNPALMNMATTMLSDPNMQQMMGQMMGAGGMMGGPGGGGGMPPVGGPAGTPGSEGPNMQEMMSQMMGGQGMGGGAPGAPAIPGAPGAPGGPPASMESLLQAGQQLAQQMQQSNPELVEQLRRQMGGGQGPFPPPGGNPPPQ